jgi:hypothetical protein
MISQVAGPPLKIGVKRASGKFGLGQSRPRESPGRLRATRYRSGASQEKVAPPVADIDLAGFS